MPVNLKYIARAIVALLVLLVAGAVAGRFWPQPSPTQTLYLTPHIQGLNLQDAAAMHDLSTLLDTLEPGGANGSVQVGYTLGFDLYDYFHKTPNGCEFYTPRLTDTLKAARALGRPVVIYVAANHFYGHAPYVQYLRTLPNASMRYSNGDIPVEQYFRTHLIPFRISNDEGLEHVRAKFEALKILAGELSILGDLLVGVSLNGETHYLFEDFFSGTGRYQNARYTDYADGPGPENLNGFEHGIFPVYGWNCGDDDVVIYKDGKELLKAATGLSRLDVYEAVDTITDANCGYRGDIDFSQWQDGSYTIDVIAHRGSKRLAINNGRFTLTVGNGGTSTAVAPIRVDGPAQGWNDVKDAQVRYVPTARQWIEARPAVIKDHIEKMADILAQNGVSRDKIYSYQLAPWLKADWNEWLFGVGRDFFISQQMRPGITLYGGLSMNERVFDYLPEGSPYGVPEFHTQMHKQKGYAKKALSYHRDKGAVFISPYFLNIEKTQKSASDHDLMLLDPNNPNRGSDDVYHAIKALAAH